MGYGKQAYNCEFVTANGTRVLVRHTALVKHVTESTFIWVRGNRQLLQAFLAEITPNPALRVYPVSLLGVQTISIGQTIKFRSKVQDCEISGAECAPG